MDRAGGEVCGCLGEVPRLRKKLLPAGKARDKARLLHLMAHPMRLQMLKLLCEEELCVCVLSRLLGRSQSNVSQHLAKLKDNGLIESRQRGKFAYYRVKNERIAEAVRRVCGLT